MFDDLFTDDELDEIHAEMKRDYTNPDCPECGHTADDVSPECGEAEGTDLLWCDSCFETWDGKRKPPNQQ